MTVPVCVCDTFELTDGVLCIKHAPADAANPTYTSGGSGGLRVNHVVPSLRFQNPGSSGTGTTLLSQSAYTQTDHDSGSAAGVWSIQGNRSITVNVSGEYALSGWGGITDKSSGTIRGGRFRILASGLTIASSEVIDYTSTIDLGTTGDGAEFNAACTTRLAAGTNITLQHLVAMGTSGNWEVAGMFNMMYLGRSV